MRKSPTAKLKVKCCFCGAIFEKWGSRCERSELHFCSKACHDQRRRLVALIKNAQKNFQRRMTGIEYVLKTRVRGVVHVGGNARDEWAAKLSGLASMTTHKPKVRTDEQRWTRRAQSAVAANKHRQANSVQRTIKTDKEWITWEACLRRAMRRQPVAWTQRDHWERKIESCVTNSRKRLKKNASIRRSRQERFGLFWRDSNTGAR